jgi:hypothetical protein
LWGLDDRLSAGRLAACRHGLRVCGHGPALSFPPSRVRCLRVCVRPESPEGILALWLVSATATVVAVGTTH